MRKKTKKSYPAKLKTGSNFGSQIPPYAITVAGFIGGLMAGSSFGMLGAVIGSIIGGLCGYRVESRDQ